MNEPVVILAGGRGSRLYGEDATIPKPMTIIDGENPILWHIMKIYAYYGWKNFILACGYKREFIEKWVQHAKIPSDWKIETLDTGLSTMTGGRLLRLKDRLKDTRFMLTYGDGVADIDINKLYNFHQINSHHPEATITATHPPARFGKLLLDGDVVVDFSEKNYHTGWINGGFFVFEPSIFDYLTDDYTYLERDPMYKLVENETLCAYKHESFWQCMDTPRDVQYLRELCLENKAPWMVWKD